MTGAFTAWHAWRRLSPAERSLLVRVALAQTIIAGLLPVVRYGTLVRSIERMAGRRHDPEQFSVERLQWALAAASGRVPGRCLARALAAHFFLQRHGFGDRVCIGATRQNAAIEAHAWIELDRRVIVGTRDPMPTELTSGGTWR